ncbi:MAG: hypothetical protein AAGA90_01620 [Actinomycetota bacterium]
MPLLRRPLAIVVLALVLVPVPVAAQDTVEGDAPAPDLISVLADIGVGRIQSIEADPPVSVDPAVEGVVPAIQVLGAATVAGPLDRFDLDGNGIDLASDLFGDPRGSVVPTIPQGRNVPLAFGGPGGPQGTVVLPLNDAFFSSWLVFTLVEVSILPSMVEGEVEVGLYASLPGLTPIGPVDGVNLPGVGATTGSSLVGGTANETRAGFIQTNGTPTPELYASGHAVSELSADDRHFVGFLTENPATSFTVIASSGTPGDPFSYSWQATPLSLEVTEVTEADLASSSDALEGRYLAAAAEIVASGTGEEEPAADGTESPGDEAAGDGADADPDADVEEAAPADDAATAEDAGAVDGADAASAETDAATEEAVIINETDADAEPDEGFEWTLVLLGSATVGAVTYFFYRWTQTKKKPKPAPIGKRILVFDPEDSHDPEAARSYIRTIAEAGEGRISVEAGFRPLIPTDFFTDDDPHGRSVPGRLRLYVVNQRSGRDERAPEWFLGGGAGAMFRELSLPEPTRQGEWNTLEVEEGTGRVYRRELPEEEAEGLDLEPMWMEHEGDFLS